MMFLGQPKDVYRMAANGSPANEDDAVAVGSAGALGAAPSSPNSSESSEGFLSWDRSRRSDEYAARAAAGEESVGHLSQDRRPPLVPIGSSCESSRGGGSGGLRLPQKQQDDEEEEGQQRQQLPPQSQQQQQTHPNQQTTGAPPNRARAIYACANPMDSDGSSGPGRPERGPTPFRPMQPREFSLGTNLRRLHPAMPSPTLPADVAASASGSLRGSPRSSGTGSALGGAEDGKRTSLVSGASGEGSGMGRISEAGESGARVIEEEGGSSSGVSSGFSATLGRDTIGADDKGEGPIVGDGGRAERKLPKFMQTLRGVTLSQQQQAGIHEEGAEESGPRPSLRCRRSLSASHQSSNSSKASKVSADYVIADVAKSSNSLFVYEDRRRGSFLSDGEDLVSLEDSMSTIDELVKSVRSSQSADRHSSSLRSSLPSSSAASEEEQGWAAPATAAAAARLINLQTLPEKRPLEVETSVEVPDMVPEPGQTPGTVSTISPEKRERDAGALAATATARFGRLLEECRNLAETCGDSATFSSHESPHSPYIADDETNKDSSSRDSPRSQTRKGSSAPSSGSGRKQPRLVPPIIRKRAANPPPAGPPALGREIDASAQLKVSQISMDPALFSSMHSSKGSMNIRTSDLLRREDSSTLWSSKSSMNLRKSDYREFVKSDSRLSVFHTQDEVPREDDEDQEELSEEPSRRTNGTSAAATGPGGSSICFRDALPAAIPTKVGDMTRRRNPAWRELTDKGVSQSAISDLSLGVDLMYGDVVEEGDAESAKQFISSLDKPSSLDKGSQHSGALSVLSTSDRAGGREKSSAPSSSGGEGREGSALGGNWGEDSTTLEPSELSRDRRALRPSYGRAFGPQEEAAPSGYVRSAEPRDDDGMRYSWLSYTTNGDADEGRAPGKASPSDGASGNRSPVIEKTSPLESGELRIYREDSGCAKSTGASTDFSGEDASGGLLVGFGARRRQIAVPSEASSISSSETSGGSSFSSSSSSGSSFSSGSDGSSTGITSSSGSGSGSSSSESETSSSEESLSLPAIARDGVQIRRDSETDLVSELSFGGASLLMARQAQATMESLRRNSVEGHRGTSPGPLARGVSPGPLTRGMSAGTANRGASPGRAAEVGEAASTPRLYAPPGGSKKSSSPDRGEDIGSHHARLLASDSFNKHSQRPGLDPLEKLDEVSESNASFLDDLSSVDENNRAVQKFLKPPESDVWSSLNSTNQGEFATQGRMPSYRPKRMLYSSRNSSVLSSRNSSVLSSRNSSVLSSRNSSVLSSGNSSVISGASQIQKIEEDAPFEDVPQGQHCKEELEQQQPQQQPQQQQQQQHQSPLGVAGAIDIIDDNDSSSSSSSSGGEREKTIPKSNTSSSNSTGSFADMKCLSPKVLSSDGAPSPVQLSVAPGVQGHTEQSNSLRSSSSIGSMLSSHADPRSPSSPGSSTSPPARDSHAASLSSGSYYEGVLARAAAMGPSDLDAAAVNRGTPQNSLPLHLSGSLSSRSSLSRSSLSQQQQDISPGNGGYGGGGEVQKAGIMTKESVRSPSPDRVSEELTHDHANYFHQRHEHQHRQPTDVTTQQGSGESPLEVPDTDGLSSMSSVVSKARNSFRGDLPVGAIAAAATAAPSTEDAAYGQQHQAEDMDAASAGPNVVLSSSGASEQSPPVEKSAIRQQANHLQGDSTVASQLKGDDVVSSISKMSGLTADSLGGTEAYKSSEPIAPLKSFGLSVSEYISNVLGVHSSDAVSDDEVETEGISGSTPGPQTQGLLWPHRRIANTESRPPDCKAKSSKVDCLQKTPIEESPSNEDEPALMNLPENRDFDKLSVKSAHEQVPSNGNELYENFPTQMPDKDDDVSSTLRKRSSSSQVPVSTQEMDSRKPWRTVLREAPMDSAVSFHVPSSREDCQESELSSSGIKDNPEPLTLVSPVGDNTSSVGDLSDLLESKETFKRMGLYTSDIHATESPAPERDKITVTLDMDAIESKLLMVEEKHVGASLHESRSSLKSSSSSISELDFSGQHTSQTVLPIVKEKSVDCEVKEEGMLKENVSIKSSEVLHHLSAKNETNLPEFSPEAGIILMDEETVDPGNDTLNRSSVKMLGDTAEEMTEILQNSFLSRASKPDRQIGFDGLIEAKSHEEKSELSADDSVNESLKSFSRGLVPLRKNSRTPWLDGEKGDAENTNEPLKANNALAGTVSYDESPNYDRENLDKLTESNKILDINVSYRKSAEETSEAASEQSGLSEGENDAIMALKSSRERSSFRIKLDDLDIESGSEIEPLQTPFEYEPARRVPRDHSSFVIDHDHDVPRGNPNPFLIDPSDDEEACFPPSASPLFIDNGSNGCKPKGVHGGDEDSPKNTRCCQRRGKCRKLLCFFATFLIVAAIAGGIAYIVDKEKKKSSNSPKEMPSLPGNPQTTTPPSRLPTPSPIVTDTPNWVQIGGDLMGESPGDEAGFSVAISDGGKIIIGARRNAKDGMKNRGAARIFEFDPNTRFYVPVWDIYGDASGDQCGFSVSMSNNGKRIAVGSLGNDKNGQNSGQVRIFDEDQSSKEWKLVSELNGEKETSLFGASVSLSPDGSSLAIGAPYYSEDTNMVRSGRSYVYREIRENIWEQVGEPMVGMSSNDLFGWSVSLLPNNAHSVAIGAPRLEGSLDSGYVKVFSMKEKGWEPQGRPMSKDVPGDRFGFSVSLAGNSTVQRVGIGAPGMSKNGEGSGMACVYENNDGDWQYFGDDIHGHGPGENVGYAVAMTPDATRMAVGVPNKKLDGVPVGQVQVVDIDSFGILQSAGNIYGRNSEKFGVSVAISYRGKMIYGGASMANLVRVYGDIH